MIKDINEMVNSDEPALVINEEVTSKQDTGGISEVFLHLKSNYRNFMII